KHPPSPDYVPGLKHPPSPVYLPYVLEPEYPEYLAPSDDDSPMEDQPLPVDSSPVALSLGYVSDSDPEEDSEEEHANYHADGGYGWGAFEDADEEPFKDEGDDDEEEEHLAPADSSAIPVVDHVPSARDTEAFETDESTPTPRLPQIRFPFAQTRLRRAQKTVRLEPPMSPSMEACIAKTDIPEAEMPPLKRACFATLAPGFEIGESSAAGAARQPWPASEADTWDEIVEAMLEVAPTTLEGVDQRVIELDITVKDRPYHRHIALALDREVVYARIAWTSSEERSAAIEAHVRTLEAQVATLIAQTTSLQTQWTTALGCI
ncbi:hypothetical protein Tco_1526313, partial [Tanacetum coccineum]